MRHQRQRESLDGLGDMVIGPPVAVVVFIRDLPRLS
jgi:hypothetical protein